MPNKPHTLDEIILRALMTAPNNMQEIVINDKPITVFEVQNYKILTASILDWVVAELEKVEIYDSPDMTQEALRKQIAKLNKEREGNDE